MATSPLQIDPADAVVLFVDVQSGIAEFTRTTPLSQLKKSVRLLTRLAGVMEMPVVLSAIRGQDGSDAKVLPEIMETLPGLTVHHRTTADSLHNQEIRSAIEATGRKTLLISGVSTEIAVLLPALTAVALGYRVYVVLDACGGASERSEHAAVLRLAHAGATTAAVLTLAGELAGDFREPKGQQAVGILYEMASD